MSLQGQPLNDNNPKDTNNIPTPPSSDNEHDFSLTDLLQPTMTLEQIKIIEMALAKIKSKRDALLSNEQQGGNTIPSYDWAMVAKQMAKALTNTCHKQSMKTTSTLTTSNTTNNDKSSSIMNTTHSDACSKPQLNPAMNVTTPPTSPTTLIPPSSSPSTSNNNNNNNNILTNNSTTTTTTTTTSVLNTDNKPTTSVEPMTEIKDGVEWVSFVYSHHRVVRRYRIRTDLGSVDITKLDEKFKSDNCVYPRANLPREAYQGNRWAYETECNMLGWKLAHLNMEEIAGKRGLIQRAVDSYRNRYPSMRSRRVARQEKLLKGTLRKRKQSPVAEDEQQQHHDPHCNLSPLSSSSTLSTTSSTPYNSNSNNNNNNTTLLSSSIHTSTTSIKPPCTKIPKLYPNQEKCKHPKTLTIEDRGVKCRVRINIDTVDLTLIDDHFKKNNCVFPRAINISSTNINITQRRKDEARCNEIGWKLAWLNPKHLANKKNLLQRILDIYRTKFVPDLTPRQSPSRNYKTMTMTLESKPTPLTTEALAAHHQQQEELAAKNGHINHNVSYICKKKENNQNKDNEEDDDNDTIYTGTTDSLDFRDCFSPPPETITSLDDLPMPSSSSSSLLLPPSSSSSSSSSSLITPLLNTTHSITTTTTAATTNDMIDFTHPLILPPPPPMKSDEYFDSLLDPLASPPPQSLSATLTTSDLMDDSSCHLSVDSSCQNSPPHRYHTSLGSFSSDDHHIFTADPLLVLQEDHHHRHHNHSTSITATKENDDDVYMFDTKPSSFLPPLLPTDIFLTTDMDWSSDVKDCMLVDVQQPDVLMNQLFST